MTHELKLNMRFYLKIVLLSTNAQICIFNEICNKLKAFCFLLLETYRMSQSIFHKQTFPIIQPKSIL